MIAARDGYLYGVNTYTSPEGEVFRMEPNEKPRILHRFDQRPGTNIGGAAPTHLFKMGEDGSLYGLTRTGGRNGCGVFYRVRPNGDFSVVVDLKDDVRLNSKSFAYTAQELIEGPDNAFYTFSPNGYAVRLGLDGSMSVLPHMGGFNRAFADPSEPGQAVVATAAFRVERTVTMRRVRLSDAAVLSSVSSPVFDSTVSSVELLAYTSRGLLLEAKWTQGSNDGSRVYWMKADGSLDLVHDFPRVPAAGEAPYLQSFMRAENDGTIYYLAGHAIQGGGPDGNTLIEYKPDGSYRVICGFGWHSMFSLSRAAPDMLYGATSGNSLIVPRDPALEYYVGWMETPADSEVVHTVKRGGILFQIAGDDSAPGDFFPLAKTDFVKAKGGRDPVISPLKNDHDPTGEKLQLVSVGPASQGSATASSNPKLKNQVIYSPAAGGRRSAVIPYVVADASNRQSTGTILFRGNAAGSYRSEGVFTGGAFTLRVSPGGAFTAAVPWASRQFSFRGSLDWTDSATVHVPGPEGKILTLSISLVTPEDSTRAFDYVVRSDGSEVSGQALLLH